MTKIPKLASLLCCLLFSLPRHSHASENITKVNNTVDLKVRVAGSSHTSPFKVRNGSPTHSYLENNNSEFSDLTIEFPDISVDQENNLNWYTNSNSQRDNELVKILKKDDLFFTMRNRNQTLEIYRSGVGSDEIFARKKLGFFSLPPGTLNKGQFSINNTAEVISQSLLYYIDTICSKDNNLRIKLQGHSRGAVGLARALDKLLAKLNTVDYEAKLQGKKVEINCVLLDPVAGPDVSDQKLNLNSNNPYVDLKLTQLFSTDPGYPSWQAWAFASSAYIPTNKFNSTVVFLPLSHEVGLKSSSKDVDGKYRKVMWKYADQLLKYGDIGQLEPGVYFPKTKFSVDDQTTKLAKAKGDKKDSKKDNLKDILKDKKEEKTIGQVPEMPNKMLNEKSNEIDNDAILLNWDRTTVSRVIPPIELQKLTDSDEKTLDEFQNRLLLDQNWLKSSYRKNTLLQLLNKSLHINEVLSPQQNLQFDSKCKLRIFKGKT